MDMLDNIFSDLFHIIKSWIPWRSDPANVSRDFWMPDHSVRVCYECDIQFTLFNRRHHCRRCGRIFCGKCTSNSIPVIFTDPKTLWEERERLRACNFCFRQWEQQNIPCKEYDGQPVNQEVSASPKGASFGSPEGGSHTPMSNPVGSYKEVRSSPDMISSRPFAMEELADRPDIVTSGENNRVPDKGMQPSCPLEFSMIRSDDDDEYTEYQSDTDSRRYPQIDRYESRSEVDESVNHMSQNDVALDKDKLDTKILGNSSLQHSFISEGSDGVPRLYKKENEQLIGDDGEVAPSARTTVFSRVVGADSVDIEKSGVMWIPPEPEDEDDDKEGFLFYDDDDEGDASGDWGGLRRSESFGSGEFRNRDKSGEDQKNVMKNVVYGHFRALVAQLLQVENLPVDGENK